MRFIAALVYEFLKILVFLTTKIFYARFTVIERKRLLFKNPAIVISNHPSTLLDPLNVGVKLAKQISFLANASLFKNPVVGAILNLYCIPVERPKDVGGRRIQNEANFARAAKHLAAGKCIYIAPEGTSEVERKVRPIKTGTARIALNAENENDFKLGLTIVPAGLNYSSPLEFQSDLLLNVGEPVKVSDYQDAYLENPFQAAKKMTSDLQQILESLVLQTTSEEQDELLTEMQIVFKSENPLPPKTAFYRSQKILSQIKNLPESQVKTLSGLSKTYFESLKKENINDLAVFNCVNNKSFLPDWFLLIVGFPFFLYGWINNFLSFYIPGLLAEKIKIYQGYKPAVMTLSGLILLPLFFYFQTRIVITLFDIPYIGWIYLLTLLPMGWLAWQYRKLFLQFFKNIKVKNMRKNHPEIFEDLQSKRERLLLKIRSMDME